MKTVKEHEEEFWKNYRKPEVERLCGLACPTCGMELWEDLTIVLTSNPPQSRIYCKKCKYVGSIH